VYIDPDGQFAFLIPFVVNIALSAAAEALLPTALEGYTGGAFVAAALSGVVNGYNGNYSGGVFSGDTSFGLCEKAGMAVGTILSYSPSKVTAKAVSRIAQSEIRGAVTAKAASTLASAASWVTRGSARQAAAKTAATTAAKTTKVTAKNGVAKSTNQAVAKNAFLRNPKDLLSETPRDSKGYLYLANNIRI
jgi:hypothetical protein